MKRYKRNKQAPPALKKVLARILFVVGAAALITIGTVFVGHRLLMKVQSAEYTPLPTGGTGISYEREDTDESRSVGNAPSIRGVGIDLLSYKSTEELGEELDELSEAFNTVVYPICDQDGQLIYQSPAVCALVRMQVTDTETLDRITDSIREAKTRGLRIIASLIPADSATDAALMKELASFGVTEILVTPSLTGTLDYETANRLRLYLNDCSEAIGDACRLGIVLPSAVYLDSAGAMQLQMIAQIASSLGIRFPTASISNPDEVYRTVSDTIQALEGTFSVYNMRVVLDETNAYRVAAEYQACADRGVMNYYFTKTVKPATLTYSGEIEEKEPDAPVTDTVSNIPESITNPYANTRETYETEAPEEEPVPAADDWTVLTTPETPVSEPQPATDWNTVSGNDGNTQPTTDWSAQTATDWSAQTATDWSAQTGNDWSSSGNGGNNWNASSDDWYDPGIWSGGTSDSSGIVTGTPPAEFIDENGNWTGWMDSYGVWHPNGGW
ncbi:MAG: hypothetical protein K6A33_02365 [Clostridiales bacterium]|nr:hypothetical protein [Clostridiales bacterium]